MSSFLIPQFLTTMSISVCFFHFLSYIYIGRYGLPVAHKVKNLPATQETQVLSLGREDPLEKGMATCFSILAWRIPRTEEPGGLRSMGLQRVRHGCSDLACTACTGGASGKEPACQCRRHKRSGFHARVEKIPWRRAWNSLQYSCLENPHGQRSLAATVRRVAESDMTEAI